MCLCLALAVAMGSLLWHVGFSLIVAHGLQSSVVAEHGLSSCGARLSSCDTWA